MPMYHFSYAEVLQDAASEARANERMALEHSIAMLRAAQAAGPKSPEGVEALSFVRRLWVTLIEDLGNPGNGLPNKLRADLISIGISIIREAESIRLGHTDNFDDLIEIQALISEGLK
jgi:flagellar biosynthesis activator protein FlaF